MVVGSVIAFLVAIFAGFWAQEAQRDGQANARKLRDLERRVRELEERNEDR